MLLSALLMQPGVVVVLAAALSSVDIYPMRSLRLLGGEVSPADENRRRSLDQERASGTRREKGAFGPVLVPLHPPPHCA